MWCFARLFVGEERIPCLCAQGTNLKSVCISAVTPRRVNHNLTIIVEFMRNVPAKLSCDVVMNSRVIARHPEIDFIART